MSTISNQPMMTGQTPQAKHISDAQFSSYVRKQSVSAYESLDAGLTIKTKEGDVVTLTSNSYAELDAYMYNSKGVLKTESGTAMATQNYREITLSSGESFTFSVDGDLSEEELIDIEAIVKGIDAIIAEVAEGDMDDAVEKALLMGGYDTVSMYAADISYERSYQMISQVQAETIKPIPEPEPVILPEKDSPIPLVKDFYPDNNILHKPQDNTIKNINSLFEKMAAELEKHEDKLVDKAQKPIDKLFRHHLDDIMQNKSDENIENQSIYTILDSVRDKIDKLIDQMTKEIFKDHFEPLL